MGLGTAFRYVLAWPLAIVLALLFLVWVFSPVMIAQQANTHLEDLDYRLGEDSHIRFNPFALSLHAETLALVQLSSNVTQASVEDLTINIDMWALFDQIVKIEAFTLNGVSLNIEREQSGLSVAGTTLGTQSTEEKPEQNDENKAPTDLDWQLIVEQFQITQFATTLIDHTAPSERKHRAVLESLNLQNVSANLQNQTAALRIDATINDAALSSTIELALNNNLGEISIEFNAESVQPREFDYLLAKFFPDPANDQFYGDVNLSVQQTIRLLEQNKVDIQIDHFQLKTQNLYANTAGIEAKLVSLDLLLKEGSVQLRDGALTNASLLPNIELSDLSVSPHEKEDVLLSIAQISIEESSLTHSQQSGFSTLIPVIKLSDIIVSEPAPLTQIIESEPAFSGLFRTEHLTIEGIVIDDSAAAIEQIRLGAFNSSINLSEDKTLTNLVLPQQNETSPESSLSESDSDLSTTEQETANTPADGFGVSIQSFELSGIGQIDIKDRSVKPAFVETLNLNKLQLGLIDTQSPETVTPFSSHINIGRYGNVDLLGQVQLVSDKLNLDVNTELKELALPKISPYLRDAAGFDILAGQFDLSTQLKVVEDELDGESVLFLRGIELETATDVKQGNLAEQSFIPLNLALGSLKDGDGNIEIDVDLSGNVNDPNVGLDGFIYLIAQKAVLSAAESYAINTFVPYANIVTLAKVAGSFALKVRVDDLIYPDQVTQVSPEQAEFIKNLAILMQQKPDIHIKLCPIATTGDLPAELQNAADLNNPATVEVLKRVAKSRGEDLKEVLINDHQIASSRLLVCQARVDGQPDAQPRIEFSI